MERLNRIKEVLVIKNLTQKELALKLGISLNAMSNICNNKAQPHLKNLFKIAELLGVEVFDLIVKK